MLDAVVGADWARAQAIAVENLYLRQQCRRIKDSPQFCAILDLMAAVGFYACY